VHQDSDFVSSGIRRDDAVFQTLVYNLDRRLLYLGASCAGGGRGARGGAAAAAGREPPDCRRGQARPGAPARRLIQSTVNYQHQCDWFHSWNVEPVSESRPANHPFLTLNLNSIYLHPTP
jgi:hypothetical protein